MAIWQIIGEILKQAIMSQMAGEAGKQSVGTDKGGALLGAIMGAKSGQAGKQTANIKGMGEVPVAPPDYYKTGGTKIGGGQPTFGQKTISALGTILGAGDGTAYAGQLPPQQQQAQNQQLQGGNVTIGGENPNAVPQHYLNMTPSSQNVAPDPNTQVGFMRGFIDALTGQPGSEAVLDPKLRQGRKTAYYAGGIIPKLAHASSGLAIPSPGEQLTQRKLNYEEAKDEAIAGNISWEKLKGMYPEKFQDIQFAEDLSTPPPINPNFREGRGLSALSPNVAPLSPQVKYYTDQITSRAHYNQVLKKWKEITQPMTEDEILSLKEYMGIR